MAPGPLAAQFDVQLPLMYGLQQTYGNPAALQDHGFTLGLPSVAAGGFTPFDLVESGDLDEGVLLIDPRVAFGQLDGRDITLRGAAVVDAVSLTFRRRATQVGVGHRARLALDARLPANLYELALEGNTARIGERIDVSPEARAFAYHEVYIQVARQVNPKLTVGLKLAYLLGAGVAQVSGERLDVFTDPDVYQTTITGDLSLRSAGLGVDIDTAAVTFRLPEEYRQAGSGLGLDLGITYRALDRLELGLALRDLGFIRWKSDATEHHFAASYTYRGVSNVHGEQDPFDATTNIGDSFLDSATITATPGAFTTALQATAQGTARYRLARYTTANATLFGTRTFSGVQGGFGVGIGQQFWELGHFGVLAGLKAGGPFASFNFMLDLFGPQIYVAVDNVWLGKDLANVNDAYVRAGLNLAFGKKKRGDYLRGWYDNRRKAEKLRAKALRKELQTSGGNAL